MVPFRALNNGFYNFISQKLVNKSEQNFGFRLTVRRKNEASLLFMAELTTNSI